MDYIQKAIKYAFKMPLILLNLKSISKSVYRDRLDIENFHISRVKFQIRILHSIFVKVLYRKPRNWERADGQDLYLMWVLLNNVCFNWVKFIL